MIPSFVFALAVAAATRPAAASDPVVRTYAAPASGIFANAYVVETPRSVVVIDATLTVSDARKLRALVHATGKPLRAVLLTHGHPDHYNGVTELLEGAADVPVIAVAGVDRVIRQYDQPKEEQWKPVFKDEWPARRTFPTRVVADGQTIIIDTVPFVAHDLGPGESHNDSYWVVGDKHPVAFIGDVVIHGMHAYLSDGHSSQWLRNIERVRKELRRRHVSTLYPGHGDAGALDMLEWQRAYLQHYRAAVSRIAGGRPALNDGEKKQLTQEMQRFLPTERLAFLIPLGADAIAAELNGEAKHDHR